MFTSKFWDDFFFLSGRGSSQIGEKWLSCENLELDTQPKISNSASIYKNLGLKLLKCRYLHLQIKRMLWWAVVGVCTLLSPKKTIPIVRTELGIITRCFEYWHQSEIFRLGHSTDESRHQRCLFGISSTKSYIRTAPPTPKHCFTMFHQNSPVNSLIYFQTGVPETAPAPRKLIQIYPLQLLFPGLTRKRSTHFGRRFSSQHIPSTGGFSKTTC